MASSQPRLGVWVFLALVVVSWALATPYFGGPDEDTHMVKAAALARGQVFGGEPPPRLDDAFGRYEVPGWMDHHQSGCHRGLPSTSATCSEPMASSNTIIKNSSAQAYMPTAHVMPAIGTLLPFGERNLVAARLLDALVPVLLIGASLLFAARTRRFLPVAAVLLATTPMALFLAAVVNPSGLAIGGALALAVGLFGARVDPSAAAKMTTAGLTALALARADGIVWAAALISLAALLDMGTLRVLLASMRRGLRGVIVAAWLFALTWRVFVPAELLETDQADGLSWTEILQRLGVNSTEYIRQAIGVVGWLDVPLSNVAAWSWLIGASGLLAVVVVLGNTRALIALASGVAGLVLIPIVLTLTQVRAVGFFWQGRYTLPLLVGIVPLMGFAAIGSCRRSGDAAPDVELSDRSLDRLGRLVAVLALVSWNVVFFHAMRRWAVGITGTLNVTLWPNWGAPLPPVAGLLLHAVATIGLYASLRRVVERCSTPPAASDLPERMVELRPDR